MRWLIGALLDHDWAGAVDNAAASHALSRCTGRRTGKALPERSDGDHVDFDQAWSGHGHGAIERRIDVFDPPHGLVRQAERLADVREVRRQDVGINLAAAILRVLDVADNAIAL